MDLIQINHIIGCISADLSLYECSICEVSLPTLRKLSSFLQERHLDFERDIRESIKDKATEFYTEELYASLTNYSYWYVENRNSACAEEKRNEAREIFEQIEIVWRPLIEELFPRLVVPGQDKDNGIENDPEGYNRTYGKPGEKYRSIRYDIIHNPEYPHLTKEIIFHRLQTIISRFPNEGADISRLLSLAYKYGLLKRLPYRKSVIRELGMKSSEQSLTEFINNKSDEISFSKRLKGMKEELLRQ